MNFSLCLISPFLCSTNTSMINSLNQEVNVEDGLRFSPSGYLVESIGLLEDLVW